LLYYGKSSRAMQVRRAPGNHRSPPRCNCFSRRALRGTKSSGSARYAASGGAPVRCSPWLILARSPPQRQELRPRLASTASTSLRRVVSRRMICKRADASSGSSPGCARSADRNVGQALAGGKSELCDTRTAVPEATSLHVELSPSRRCTRLVSTLPPRPTTHACPLTSRTPTVSVILPRLRTTTPCGSGPLAIWRCAFARFAYDRSIIRAGSR